MSEFETMIPIGFRFDPTDEELIGGFLWARVMGYELPWNGVVEKELYGENLPREPWEVFGDIDESSMYWHSKREGGATKNTIYAFTTLLRVPNSSRFSRRAGCGTWGGQTGPKKIKNSDTGELIGNSKMFAFEHPGSAAEAEVGHWTMHEYSLSDRMVKLSGKANGADLVLCKITKTIKKMESGGKRTPPQQQVFSPAAIGYEGGGVDFPVVQPELVYSEISDGGDSIDVLVAQPLLCYPEIGDGSGSVSQPELCYLEIGDCGGSIDVSDGQPEFIYISDSSDSIEQSCYPIIGDGCSSIQQSFFSEIGDGCNSIEQSCYPVIGDGGCSIDVSDAQPEFIYISDGSDSIEQSCYPVIGDGGSSIQQLCYPAIGDGGCSIDIPVPAATASNKRAAEEEEEHPDEEVGRGFKRQKTSCIGDVNGEGFTDAAAEGFLLGGDDWLPSGFDDNIDVEGLFRADFSFDNEFLIMGS